LSTSKLGALFADCANPEKYGSCPRYLCAAGASVIPYITSEVSAVAADVSTPTYIVEAPLKALSLIIAGFLAVGLGGVVAGAHDKAALAELGEIVAHPELARPDARAHSRQGHVCLLQARLAGRSQRVRGMLAAGGKRAGAGSRSASSSETESTSASGLTVMTRWRFR